MYVYVDATRVSLLAPKIAGKRNVDILTNSDQRRSSSRVPQEPYMCLVLLPTLKLKEIAFKIFNFT